MDSFCIWEQADAFVRVRNWVDNSDFDGDFHEYLLERVAWRRRDSALPRSISDPNLSKPRAATQKKKLIRIKSSPGSVQKVPFLDYKRYKPPKPRSLRDRVWDGIWERITNYLIRYILGPTLFSEINSS